MGDVSCAWADYQNSLNNYLLALDSVYVAIYGADEIIGMLRERIAEVWNRMKSIRIFPEAVFLRMDILQYYLCKYEGSFIVANFSHVSVFSVK